MRFEFATATRIVFGAGTLPQAAAAAAEWGRRILLVAADAVRAGGLLCRSLLEAHSEVVVDLPVTGEPTIESVSQGVQVAREAALRCRDRDRRRQCAGHAARRSRRC